MILNLMSYLGILIPLALITGPFLPDLFVVINCILLIYLVIKKNLINELKIPFSFFFIVFYLLIITSSLFSENQTISLKSSVPYVRFLIFSFSIYLLCQIKKNFFERFFYFLFFIFLILIFDTIMQYYLGYNIVGYELFKQNEYYRATSFFNTDLKLGSYLARLSPFFIYSFIFFPRLNNKYIFTFILISLLSAVLFTGERTAIFLFIMSLIFLTIFINEKSLKKNLFFSLIFVFITSVLILSLNQNIKDRVINQTNFQLFEYEKSTLFFSHHHKAHYQASLEIYNDNKFLGAGPKSYRYQSKKDKYLKNNLDAWSTHPHNTYMQLLSETGIFSFLMVILLFCYFFFNSILHFFKIRIFFHNDLSVCSICCFLITLWPIAPSGSFFNNWICIIYFIPVGFYWYANKKQNKEII